MKKLLVILLLCLSHLPWANEGHITAQEIMQTTIADAIVADSIVLDSIVTINLEVNPLTPSVVVKFQYDDLFRQVDLKRYELDESNNLEFVFHRYHTIEDNVDTQFIRFLDEESGEILFWRRLTNEFDVDGNITTSATDFWDEDLSEWEKNFRDILVETSSDFEKRDRYDWNAASLEYDHSGKSEMEWQDSKSTLTRFNLTGVDMYTPNSRIIEDELVEFGIPTYWEWLTYDVNSDAWSTILKEETFVDQSEFTGHTLFSDQYTVSNGQLLVHDSLAINYNSNFQVVYEELWQRTFPGSFSHTETYEYEYDNDQRLKRKLYYNLQAGEFTLNQIDEYFYSTKTTAINDLRQDLKAELLFSNPNTGEGLVRVQSDDHQQEYQLILHDNLGASLYKSVVEDGSTIELNQMKLQSGTYFLRLENKTGISTWPIVIQK